MKFLNNFLGLKYPSISINLYVSLFALSCSLYSEYILNYAPCTLCILQRICFISLLVISIIFFLTPFKNFIFNFLSFFFIVTGGLISWRQVYLQNSPKVNSILCESTQISILDMSIMDILQDLVSGTGNCSDVLYELFGLSFAEWSLLIFIFLFLINIFFTLISKKTRY